MDTISEQALAFIRHLSVNIGGRGSCTQQERQAGEYVRQTLESFKLREVKTETFQAVSSTYRPFALAFVLALVGALSGLVIGNRIAFTFAAIANFLGAWGMFAETEFKPNWTRWLSPKAQSQNITGSIPSTGTTQQRIVLCAHLDTHRTPVFYSSKAWHRTFSTLVSMSFASMLLGGLAFCIGAAFGWTTIRWVGIITVPVGLFALSLCIHADFTPFSPGANDNASGVAVILGMAQRLMEDPLANTEVLVLFTGCEEVGAYGMTAFLDAHGASPGIETIYITLDEVGLGSVKYLTADGLVIKHQTHPKAVEIARQAASSIEPPAYGGIGIAYTDALPATKQGHISLTVCTIPAASSDVVSHWHQMSDTLEHVDRNALNQVSTFVWQILQNIDQQARSAKHGILKTLLPQPIIEQ